ncbi:MAG: hypothetical protein IPM95_06465 [Sphingobacteriales bacterium]|nr:hypothetical protein [Sphingobacteriales bacterium]
MQIKNKLQKIIVSKKYQDSVREFIKTFETVAGLQNQYFKNYISSKKAQLPEEKLKLIREYSINSTIASLTEYGLNVNILDKVEDIIRQNTTTGGSYSSLQGQLRDFILSDKNTDGALVRYTKTITTDAINQYSRQYMETTAADLDMPWRKYIGSLKTTSREWCEKMVAKKFVHVSELPELVKGNIDGHQCGIYKKTADNKGTDLPYGMIAGTNAQNVLVRAGGHGCEHGFYPCDEDEVPKEVLDRFKVKITVVARIPKSSLLYSTKSKKVDLNRDQYDSIKEYENGSSTAIHKRADKGDDFNDNVISTKIYANQFKDMQALVAEHSKVKGKKNPELLLNGIKADNKKPNHSDTTKGTAPYKNISSAITNGVRSAIGQGAIPIIILEKRYNLQEIITGVSYGFETTHKNGNKAQEIHLRYRDESITIITREQYKSGDLDKIIKGGYKPPL